MFKKSAKLFRVLIKRKRRIQELMRKIGVLVFPAGEINSIEIHDALSTCVNIKLWGASSIERHGKYVFENYIPNLPLISENNFLDELNKIIKEKSIDVIFPTHDTVVSYLAMHKDKINAKIIANDERTAQICRDKSKTYELFRDCDFCPKVYEKIDNYPLILKPTMGQGGQGVVKVEKNLDIPNNIKYDQMVITEYLPGDELTVDCITDRRGKLKTVLPRTRERCMAGVTVRGKTISATEEIQMIAETINKRLKFEGMWYFQLKQDKNNKYKLLEVSARCAGTMCLSRARGINLPLLTVYVAMGREIDVFENISEVIVDRSLISRYTNNIVYKQVYIDYDDTIIINNKVYLQSISYLYQCRNKGIKITLLTRHKETYKESVIDSLGNYRIDKQLFDEIIELKNEEMKVEYIKTKNAIFIDNAFRERKMVHDKLNIPVFDVEGLEVLMDWRT